MNATYFRATAEVELLRAESRMTWKRLGTGGTIKDGWIEIQGDQRGSNHRGTGEHGLPSETGVFRGCFLECALSLPGPLMRTSLRVDVGRPHAPRLPQYVFQSQATLPARFLLPVSPDSLPDFFRSRRHEESRSVLLPQKSGATNVRVRPPF